MLVACETSSFEAPTLNVKQSRERINVDNVAKLYVTLCIQINTMLLWFAMQNREVDIYLGIYIYSMLKPFNPAS